MPKYTVLLPALGLATALGMTASMPAHAGESTRVATAFEDDNPFDIHFGVGYDYEFKRAAILREWNGGEAGDTRNQLVKDLIYQQQRHTINTSLEVGVWHDLSVYFALPIIVADNRDYSFDQRSDDCVFGDQVPPQPEANCVNKNNSTTIRDSILPRNGFDATDTGAPFAQFSGEGTEAIFKGPTRRGLDQLHVGIKYGILNQTKRSHMPNWVIAAEGRFAVGRAMSFSRDIQVSEPSGNSRVGRRIHELGFWTSLSRRYRFLDPYFSAFWRQSIRASNSKFQDFGRFGAQGRTNPQSSAGLTFGTEIVPWERKAKKQKVSVVIEGSAVLHYDGRGYSEIWEVLADSPSLAGSFDPTNASNCDRGAAIAFSETNPGDSGYLEAGGGSCQKFEGITDLQDYATFGLNTGLNFHIGQYARLNLGVKFNTDTRHFITNASRGDAGQGGNPDLVEPGTTEVNPVRRDVVDNVGRRYVVDDVFDFHGYLNFLLTF